MANPSNIAADSAATSSALLAGATWVADLSAGLQILATFVAIVAGAGAAWWHIEKAMQARRERLRAREEAGE